MKFISGVISFFEKGRQKFRQAHANKTIARKLLFTQFHLNITGINKSQYHENIIACPLNPTQFVQICIT